MDVLLSGEDAGETSRRRGEVLSLRAAESSDHSLRLAERPRCGVSKFARCCSGVICTLDRVLRAGESVEGLTLSLEAIISDKLKDLFWRRFE